MRYSNDFRKLAMKMLDSGQTVAQVVEAMGMGVDTLYYWIKKNKEGTLFDIINNGGHPTVYDMDGLRAFVEANPDKYLREIKVEFFEARGQKASFNGIHKALKKLDLGLKKNSTLRGAK
jgi:transposase-like protein